MTAFLRVIVGAVSICALVPILIGFAFLTIMGHGFGYQQSDVAGGAGMFFGVVYFAGALITCFPQFPAAILGRFGLVLHLLIMPVSVVLLCVGLGTQGTLFFIPGGFFAALWFIMARSIIRCVA